MTRERTRNYQKLDTRLLRPVAPSHQKKTWLTVGAHMPRQAGEPAALLDIL